MRDAAIGGIRDCSGAGGEPGDTGKSLPSGHGLMGGSFCEDSLNCVLGLAYFTRSAFCFHKTFAPQKEPNESPLI